ncbi:TlpA disulfide reductase family protein [Clostridium tyrobutyricum]|uniref:Cytochrome c biogenesis protein n=1 Tax=Clostridium tyrobutyricum TaxID=1519 RepID=A0A0A7HGW4_CLOTY|nr:TlpA disulfide reductase family protein [Clostridium tyrobutyricum]AIZ03772.1 cytochrome c biogenesis protein [Clostridium tyrobutyricum]MBV4415787.1 TlpA family protein disulfide reductase [Clostridium tyrobutyricum]
MEIGNNIKKINFWFLTLSIIIILCVCINNPVGASSKVRPLDFNLVDQYGKKHNLSSYKGKTVFLNFWATWCPPCRMEISDINKIYRQYGNNKNNVIILGIAAPDIENEISKQGITDFLNKNKYDFPVLFDTGGNVMDEYSVSVFPTTFLIDKAGNLSRIIEGSINKDEMNYLINNIK